VVLPVPLTPTTSSTDGVVVVRQRPHRAVQTGLQLGDQHVPAAPHGQSASVCTSLAGEPGCAARPLLRLVHRRTQVGDQAGCPRFVPRNPRRGHRRRSAPRGCGPQRILRSWPADRAGVPSALSGRCDLLGCGVPVAAGAGSIGCVGLCRRCDGIRFRAVEHRRPSAFGAVAWNGRVVTDSGQPPWLSMRSGVFGAAECDFPMTRVVAAGNDSRVGVCSGADRLICRRR